MPGDIAAVNWRSWLYQVLGEALGADMPKRDQRVLARQAYADVQARIRADDNRPTCSCGNKLPEKAKPGDLCRECELESTAW